jgi:tetrapyrrole methylase family protein/MazG family protein
MNNNEAFEKLYEIIVRLRGPGGCPWDIEQTPLTLRSDLIEETYECVEAIDEQNPPHIKEELGDLFLLVTMLSYMNEQEGHFTVAEVLQELSEKLIRRHPHVFENAKGADPSLTSEEVLVNWAKIKVEQEGRKPKDSLLDEVSRGLPPLDRAWKLQKKAAKAGFDWPDVSGVIAKIKEELQETEAAMINAPASSAASAAVASASNTALEGELGDLLFSVVNLCRFLSIEPSVALQRTNIKFTERFKHVERRMKETGREMNAKNLDIMNRYWDEAKGKT